MQRREPIIETQEGVPRTTCRDCEEGNKADVKKHGGYCSKCILRNHPELLSMMLREKKK